MQIRPSQRHHLCIFLRGKQSHNLLCTKIHQNQQNQTIYQFNPDSTLKSPADSFFFACPLILGNKSRHGMPDVLLRNIRKIIHAVYCRKCCHYTDSLGVDHCLNDCLSNLKADLLHGTGASITNSLFHQTFIKHKPPLSQAQKRNPLPEIHRTKKTAAGLT